MACRSRLHVREKRPGITMCYNAMRRHGKNASLEDVNDPFILKVLNITFYNDIYRGIRYFH